MTEPRALPSGLEVDIPPQIWMRSGRSWHGTALRVYLGISLVAIAFMVPRGSVAFWAWIVAGVAVFAAFPIVAQMILKPLTKKIDEAGKKQASELLSELRERRLVRMCAPNAWTTFQEAKLHLRMGDGRAAAKAFADTAKLSRVKGSKPALVSAQAHCLLLAGDRREARELLAGLRKGEKLGANDRLNLAISMLFEPSHGTETRELLEQASDELGDHPRVLAAMSIVRERDGDPDRAIELLERAEQEQAEHEEADRADPLAVELIKRARKGLRTHLRAQQKQRGKQRPDKKKKPSGASAKDRDTPDENGSPSGRRQDESKAKTKKSEKKHGAPKGSKKARKQARREARRQAKAEERARRQAEREAEQRREEQERRRQLETVLEAGESPTPSVAAPVQRSAAIAFAAKPSASPSAPSRPAAVASTPSVPKPKVPPLPSIFAPPIPSVPKPPAPAKVSTEPKPKPFAPPSSGKKPLVPPFPFAPPAGKSSGIKPLAPPPPVLPPPPRTTATPPAPSDDGWGDALGDPVPPKPTDPSKD